MGVNIVLFKLLLSIETNKNQSLSCFRNALLIWKPPASYDPQHKFQPVPGHLNLIRLKKNSCLNSYLALQTFSELPGEQLPFILRDHSSTDPNRTPPENAVDQSKSSLRRGCFGSKRY